jgi:hypothetical protein
VSVTPEEELAVLREYCEKARLEWTCMGDFFVGWDGNNTWTARRIDSSVLRGVSYAEDAILAEKLPLASCILAARAKLQAEQDAKDAPKLREERDKFKAALEKIAKKRYVYCEIYDIANDALKGTP